MGRSTGGDRVGGITGADNEVIVRKKGSRLRGRELKGGPGE